MSRFSDVEEAAVAFMLNAIRRRTTTLQRRGEKLVNQTATVTAGRRVGIAERLSNKKVTEKDSHVVESVSVTLQNGISANNAQRQESRQGIQAVASDCDESDRTSSQSNRPSSSKCYQCPECDMKFAIARVLETHRMLEHQVPAQCKCKECGVQFLNETNCIRHVNEKHSTKSFQCLFAGCTAKFSSKADMTKHQIHHSEVPKQVYKCQHCTAEYSQQCRLRYHMRVHTGEKPFPCSFCPQKFMTSSNRGVHVKQHHMARTRKFLCSSCGQKYYTARDLEKHTRHHTGEKPYSCPVCSQAFGTCSGMKTHLKSQHTGGAKPYVCDHCGVCFTAGASLRRHLSTAHKVTVDTSRYKRQEESGSHVPRIGRPKRKDL